MRKDESTTYLVWLSTDVILHRYLKGGLGSEGGESPILLQRMEH